MQKFYRFVIEFEPLYCRRQKSRKFVLALPRLANSDSGLDIVAVKQTKYVSCHIRICHTHVLSHYIGTGNYVRTVTVVGLTLTV